MLGAAFATNGPYHRPIAQLLIYALALTRLVPGLRLFDIKCAWFNEEEYCEFFPRTALAKPTGVWPDNREAPQYASTAGYFHVARDIIIKRAAIGHRRPRRLVAISPLPRKAQESYN